MSRRKIHPAIWFLGLIIGGTILALGGFIWINQNQARVMELAFVPSHPIAQEPEAPAPDYNSTSAWAALPNIESWARKTPDGLATETVEGVDVFFIHPTTALKKDRWNARLHDDDAVARLETFALKHQASAFNAAGRIYAPRYRQASFGAFFDKTGQGAQALFKAYADVLKAFDHYMANHNDGRPFILAGHSQGALHGLMLLRDRIADPTLKKQMVAAYLIGWPISLESDLGALGMSACASRNDTGCVVSWQSFGPEGNPTDLINSFNILPGVTGKSHIGTQMLCSNPLTWTIGGQGKGKFSSGALPVDRVSEGYSAMAENLTGANCGDDGILYLTTKPLGSWREFMLAGDNFHPYDINLFWLDLRANAENRSRQFLNKFGGN